MVPRRDEPLVVRRPRRGRWLWLVVAVALVALGAWYATHPAPLPSAGGTVTASTPAGAPVFIGLTDIPGEGRVVHVREVEVPGLSGRGEAAVLICRSGQVGVTSSADAFCEMTGPASGADLDLGAGDQLVLRLVAEEPGQLSVPGVRIAFREGLQWGDQLVGPEIRVTVLPVSPV